MRIITFDPGNSTGWTVYDTDSSITYGGTIVEDFPQIKEVMKIFLPKFVVYETFALYPGVAKSLSWNTFYPCEVIGVIKLIAQLNNMRVENQSPSIKKYAGKVDFKKIFPWGGQPITGHTKDAYLHLAYFMRTSNLVERGAIL